MEYPNEIKITNFSPLANAHRNLNREVVDKLFHEAEQLAYKAKNRRISEDQKKNFLKKSYGLQQEARQLWRKIVAQAQTL